jgi:hypothetical protein
MFCLNCGKEIVDGMKFCMNCGTSVANQNVSSNNDFFVPTENSGFKKMCNALKLILAITVGVFLLIQIKLTSQGGGINPSISLYTILGMVAFLISFYFIGKNAIKNKCKNCNYFDGSNNCTRMNMGINEAIEFDCKCR